MTIEDIIKLVLLIVVIIVLFTYYLIKAIRNKWFKTLLSTIETSIKEAEKKFPESGSGNKKKEYVLNKVEIKCEELGIPYKLLKKLITTAIDKIIANYNVIIK